MPARRRVSASGQPVIDRDAALRILAAHRAEFVAFAAARLDSRGTAEDLVQDALARGVERVGELRAGDAVLGWFHAILRNAITDHHRRRAASARAVARLASEPDDVAEVRGRPCQCVSHLAAALGPDQAQALQRIEVDGVPVADLAREAGIAPGTAAVRVHRARKALRRKVMATCGVCAEAGCTDCTCDQPGPDSVDGEDTKGNGRVPGA